ncbi:MAG: adenylate kinase [Proteobacteria bacterium]|nr:adenylate kinase [Pseudomonadota bacterium]
MPRVVIVGSSCAGKTTLARELATTLAHPHIELDALHWMPDWQERAVDEFRAVLAREIAAGAWVLDGNYLSQAQDIVWPRATHVVWLNYSFPVVMKRALVRTVRRSLVREHLWSGNRESWRRSFMSRDSILLWVVTSFRDRRRTLRQLFDNPDLWPEIDHIELTHPSQAGPLVRQMERLSCLQAR